LPEGTLEQARFLAGRFRRSRPWQLVGLEVAQAGRWMTADAALQCLRWVADRNRVDRRRYERMYAAEAVAALEEDELEDGEDSVIAAAWAVAEAASRLVGAPPILLEAVRRAFPALTGDELRQEVRETHEALLQAAAGNQLSDEARRRALTAVGLSDVGEGEGDPFRFLRWFVDADALPDFAVQLTAGDALLGCLCVARLPDLRDGAEGPGQFGVRVLALLCWLHVEGPEVIGGRGN
jgi:hypothetical protein